MAGPIPSRRSSLGGNMDISSSTSREFCLYKGVSERPLGWKPRRSTKLTELASTARDVSVRRWDGAARSSTAWDGLRRDAELWYPEGDCFVHLYRRGQSKRGPAFRVPMDALLGAKCRPLLDRFLAQDIDESPISEIASSNDSGYFDQSSPRKYELYIPAPPMAERGQAFLYHNATRNFFAWIFGKSLVGSHLGGALVGLLNSMTEFCSAGEDNLQNILDYMDQEGYADMRSSPDHALAILFFAEHFSLKDLWINAFAHCTGMHEKLAFNPGFEFMSRTSRALVTRSKLEMDIRLEDAGRRLGSFLSDDLSDAHLGLTAGGRSHLDKFRSFLQSHYVAKLGYYPPLNGAFPKDVYAQMCSEFQKLYDFLVDTHFSTGDDIPTSQQGGICVFQSVQAFDASHKYSSLPHPLPLLPEVDKPPSGKSLFSRRLSFAPKADKMKPDARLVAFSSLSKATNRKDQSINDCTLVRAYRGFEKDHIFSSNKVDRKDRLSQTDARKIRWILIYSILQTLLSVTKAPEQVRDTRNVPYHICVLAAGCPPWKNKRSFETLLRTQSDQVRENFIATLSKHASATECAPCTPAEIKPDIDYSAIARQRKNSYSKSAPTASTTLLRKGSVKQALSTLGNMPELRHPRPQRASFHEILVQGYGNGTNSVRITTERRSSPVEEEEENPRKHSPDSRSLSAEDLSSRWSDSSVEAGGFDSPRTSISERSRRGSYGSISPSTKVIQEFLDCPMSSISLGRVPSCLYSESNYVDTSVLQPDPLQVRKNMKVTTECSVSGGKIIG